MRIFDFWNNVNNGNNGNDSVRHIDVCLADARAEGDGFELFRWFYLIGPLLLGFAYFFITEYRRNCHRQESRSDNPGVVLKKLCHIVEVTADYTFPEAGSEDSYAVSNKHRDSPSHFDTERLSASPPSLEQPEEKSQPKVLTWEQLTQSAEKGEFPFLTGEIVSLLVKSSTANPFINALLNSAMQDGDGRPDGVREYFLESGPDNINRAANDVMALFENKPEKFEALKVQLSNLFRHPCSKWQAFMDRLIDTISGSKDSVTFHVVDKRNRSNEPQLKLSMLLEAVQSYVASVAKLAPAEGKKLQKIFRSCKDELRDQGLVSMYDVMQVLYVELTAVLGESGGFGLDKGAKLFVFCLYSLSYLYEESRKQMIFRLFAMQEGKGNFIHWYASTQRKEHWASFWHELENLLLIPALQSGLTEEGRMRKLRELIGFPQETDLPFPPKLAKEGRNNKLVVLKNPLVEMRDRLVAPFVQGLHEELLAKGKDAVNELLSSDNLVQWLMDQFFSDQVSKAIELLNSSKKKQPNQHDIFFQYLLKCLREVLVVWLINHPVLFRGMLLARHNCKSNLPSPLNFSDDLDTDSKGNTSPVSPTDRLGEAYDEYGPEAELGSSLLIRQEPWERCHVEILVRYLTRVCDSYPTLGGEGSSERSVKKSPGKPVDSSDPDLMLCAQGGAERAAKDGVDAPITSRANVVQSLFVLVELCQEKQTGKMTQLLGKEEGNQHQTLLFLLKDFRSFLIEERLELLWRNFKKNLLSSVDDKCMVVEECMVVKREAKGTDTLKTHWDRWRIFSFPSGPARLPPFGLDGGRPSSVPMRGGAGLGGWNF